MTDEERIYSEMVRETNLSMTRSGFDVITYSRTTEQGKKAGNQSLVLLINPMRSDHRVNLCQPFPKQVEGRV